MISGAKQLIILLACNFFEKTKRLQVHNSLQEDMLVMQKADKNTLVKKFTSRQKFIELDQSTEDGLWLKKQRYSVELFSEKPNKDSPNLYPKMIKCHQVFGQE